MSIELVFEISAIEIPKIKLGAFNYLILARQKQKT